MLADLLGLSCGGNLTLFSFCPKLFRKIGLDKVISASYTQNMLIEANNERIQIMVKQVRLTKAQREALKAYRFVERQEDRYLGSVFVTPVGQREYEQRKQAAYEVCTRLGISAEHGL